MIGSVITSFCAIRPNLPKSRTNRANRVNFLVTIFFSRWLLSSWLGAARFDSPHVGIIHEAAIRSLEELYHSHVGIVENLSNSNF